MSKRLEDPGVGAISEDKAQRFINPNGSFNVKHLNKKKSLNEAYTFLIGTSWLRFFLFLFAGFTIINLAFGAIYVFLGVQNIGVKSSTLFIDFVNAIFFSVQTLTTLGYGHFSPYNIATGVVSSIQAILGLISFAFITGLLYGRFSKPHPNIKFSTSFLLCNHKGKQAIMFRLMSRRKGLVIQPKIRVSLSMSVIDEQGALKNEFYKLSLEREKITYLPTTWTLVHSIDDDSPFKKYSTNEIKELQGELLILFSYHDEHYNEELHQVHSYIFKDLKVGYVFKKAFYYNNDGQMLLDHNLIDAIEPQNLVTRV